MAVKLRQVVVSASVWMQRSCKTVFKPLGASSASIASNLKFQTPTRANRSRSKGLPVEQRTEVSVKCVMPRSKPPYKLTVLPLLLLCYGLGNVHCSTPTVHDNREDLNSLLDFKNGITSDPNRALSNWNTSIHFCHWHGVNCSSNPPYRVTRLILSGHNLAGQISSSLGNLTFLNVLALNNNSFHGPIPPLYKLQNLEHLDLRDNLLQGVIPDTLTNCSNLLSLDLSRNSLTGVIPPRIGFLTKLRGLSFHQNNLSGVIPPGLGNVTNLTAVDLSYNQLNGSIPNEFWQMPNIASLYLNENNLSGEIPRTLSKLSALQQLSLEGNMLGNTLPPNIGDAFPSLQILSLGNNMFEGHIPVSLGNVLGLTVLDLSNNKLTGQIPNIFGNMSGLSFLNLEGNMLEASHSGDWEFFDGLASCRSLEELSLAGNQLQGVIPNSISNLSTNLRRLLMNENSLSGIVPSSMGKLNGLTQLSLGYNNLTGTIEEWIGELTSLQRLSLHNNYFVGTIPLSIGNITQLSYLSFQKNQFTGFIPPSLGNLTQLASLYLSYNNFQGSIPAEFGKLKQLILLDISANELSGEIPETLGQCQQLVTIQMSQNNLTGNIPTTFSKLTTLSVLNVSHNSLSGPIPDYLNDLILSKLDLSYNNFGGQIPQNGIFSNATVVLLDGNPGLCGGVTGFHKSSCHVASRRARITNYLIKILIPIFGFLSLILLVYFLLVGMKKSRTAYLSSQLSFGEHFEKVTYKELAQATRDFSEENLIGRGSYGSVYRGKLKESKMEVAVKVFNLQMPGAERSFLSECEALRSIQHRNLLPILTACSTIDSEGNVFKALIYEFMPNGNLDTWLHYKGDKEGVKSLSLTQRIGIVVNIADALDYLHHDCGRPTVHCDLKPSNILLDDDMNGLLGDFGIARLYVHPQSTWAGSASSIGVKGTIGYIPPEYGGGSHASTSGDVYSFGIVLLEILTSKRPTDPLFTDGLDIISFVENSFPDQIFNVTDAHLLEECKKLTQEKGVPENEIKQCLMDMLQVALSCTRSLPSERSNMKQVASKMHAIRTSHRGWKNKYSRV